MLIGRCCQSKRARRSDPVAILPGVRRVVRHAAGGFGAQEHLPRVGIGLSRPAGRGCREFRICRRGRQSRPGMNNSQMPEVPRQRIGWRRPSQSLKSPITLTRCTAGAHTANRQPVHAVDGFQACAQHFPGFEMAPFAEQVQIHLAQLRRKAVGALQRCASRPRPCPASATSGCGSTALPRRQQPFETVGSASPASCGRRPLRLLRRPAETHGSGCCRRAGCAAPALRTDRDACRSARAGSAR